MNPSPTILVVDDERDNRELVEVIFTSEGFLVLTAASGEEALTLAAARRPDLILLDALLPGISGYEVLAEIKGNPATEHIPIILFSAATDRDARTRAMSAGAADFLTKPTGYVELVSRVKSVLLAPSGQPAE